MVALVLVGVGGGARVVGDPDPSAGGPDLHGRVAAAREQSGHRRDHERAVGGDVAGPGAGAGAARQRVDGRVVGPEDPLANGIVFA